MDTDVVELIPQLHLLRLGFVQAYLWRDAAGLTLIDTGAPGNGELIEQSIRGLGYDSADLHRIVLTHYHGDHVGSVLELASKFEVTVYAHRDDAPVIRGHAQGSPPDLTDWERELFAQVVGDKPAPVPPARVDVEVTDGSVIDFGGGARVVAAPGHTPGSIGLHLPEAGVLFTGDAIAARPDGTVMSGVFNVDRAQAAQSSARLAALDAEIACFGHGDPVTRGARTALRAIAEG
jgi:glyoxylase-like metal-dependent hydrolase (beta-lactamase superfamily II)